MLVTRLSRITFGACTLSLLSAAMIFAADDDGPTFTDPNHAGDQFALQGEYKGKLEVNNGQIWGAQVIAMGKDDYRLVGYPDGLPGDGYTPGSDKRFSEGKREGERIVFKGDDVSSAVRAEVTAESITVSANGQTLGKLTRVNRQSSTLGKRPPAGAIVLFDGSSADQFEGGKLTEDKLLMADTVSREKFGDHEMHIEFRTPFRPEARGQARGNSGVYVQSRYEVQVLDSFGLSGENNECGGIYQIAKPKVNMCYPPLAWQTYDIDFTAARYDASGSKTSNARLTLRHNGVVIHDNLELKHGTPGRLPEGPSAEGVYLQGHGNPVVYRNIWVIKK